MVYFELLEKIDETLSWVNQSIRNPYPRHSILLILRYNWPVFYLGVWLAIFIYLSITQTGDITVIAEQQQILFIIVQLEFKLLYRVLFDRQLQVLIAFCDRMNKPDPGNPYQGIFDNVIRCNANRLKLIIR